MPSSTLDECREILEQLEEIPAEHEEEASQQIYEGLHRLFRFSQAEEEQLESRLDRKLENLRSVTADPENYTDLIARDTGLEIEEDFENYRVTVAEKMAYRKAIDEFQQARSLREFASSMKRGLELESGHGEERDLTEYSPESLESGTIKDIYNSIGESSNELDNLYAIAVQSTIAPIASNYSEKKSDS